MVSTVLSFLLMLGLLLTDAHAAFASLFPAGVEIQMFAVMLLQTLADLVVDVVIGYINTMVIEEKYGFNRTTVKTFVIDQIRGLIIGFGLSYAMMPALYLLHRGLGDWVVVLFAAVMFVLTLITAFLYPWFSPAISREDVASRETKSLLQRAYNGSVGLLVSAMAQSHSLTKEDIDELYAILKKAEEDAK